MADIVLMQDPMHYTEAKMFRIEHNVETGEVKEIQLTAAEIKEIKELNAAAKIKQDAIQIEIEAELAAKEAILDRIGLTADELKTILG